MRNARGFSLIELMVTIAIVAILAALAAPSFKSLLLNSQIRTAGQALTDGLNLARVEAIRRNERVIFSKGTQSAWTVSLESDLSILQSRPFSEGSSSVTVTVTPTGATRVTFDGLGRVVTNADATATITQMAIDVPTTSLSAAQSKDLRIDIANPGGAVRLCDPNGTAGVGAGC